MIAPPPLPDADFRRPLRLGAALVALGFGGFLVWAALAPLEEAVPAAAVVSVEGKRKRIEHLDGGMVERILVGEGEQVREGQELVVLNEVQSKAALSALRSQWRVARAAQARLGAEAAGLNAIAFPPELRDDAEAVAVMQAQEQIFRSRRGALEGELRILGESVRGLEQQLATLEELRRGRGKQVALFREQMASYSKLSGQGFVSRNHVLEQERQLAELLARQSEDLAAFAGIKARLAEFRMRGSQRETEYRREVETQLAEVQKEAATLAERVAAQGDAHARLVIRAPVAGTVVDLAASTVGGVVKPGDRVLDIVPSGGEVIAEARLAPQYVDRVRPGLPVNLHFDAYISRAQRPVIAGVVQVVSADALTDPKSGQSYYAMRITLPPEAHRQIGELALQPGMQATAMVRTGTRSLLVYLARPLLRRFTPALAEY